MTQYLEHTITKQTNKQYKIEGVLFQYESEFKNINHVKKELREKISYYLHCNSNYMGNVYTRRGSSYYEYRNNGQFTTKEHVAGRIGFTSHVRRFNTLKELINYKKRGNT